MKKILIFFIIFTASCKAQTPILDIHESSFANIENAYYKDIDNFYDQFVGTWVYIDATKTIRFKFVKKPMFYYESTVNCYVDFLIGEVQYIENGVEKFNSLLNATVNHTSIFDYTLSSIGKLDSDWPPMCDECPANVERLAMKYDEPTNDDAGLDAIFYMRRADENGVQKIKLQYRYKHGAIGLQDDLQSPSTTTSFTIPFQDYVLTKQL